MYTMLLWNVCRSVWMRVYRPETRGRYTVHLCVYMYMPIAGLRCRVVEICNMGYMCFRSCTRHSVTCMHLLAQHLVSDSQVASLSLSLSLSQQACPFELKVFTDSCEGEIEIVDILPFDPEVTSALCHIVVERGVSEAVRDGNGDLFTHIFTTPHLTTIVAENKVCQCLVP